MIVGEGYIYYIDENYLNQVGVVRRSIRDFTEVTLRWCILKYSAGRDSPALDGAILVIDVFLIYFSRKSIHLYQVNRFIDYEILRFSHDIWPSFFLLLLWSTRILPVVEPVTPLS